MKVKSYRLIKPVACAPGVETGTIVYKSMQYDYGLANEDTYTTGIIHISVTLDPSGGYPLFTCPVVNLEEIPD